MKVAESFILLINGPSLVIKINLYHVLSISPMIIWIFFHNSLSYIDTHGYLKEMRP